jgi:hypothetical protein
MIFAIISTPISKDLSNGKSIPLILLTTLIPIIEIAGKRLPLIGGQ